MIIDKWKYSHTTNSCIILEKTFLNCETCVLSTCLLLNNKIGLKKLYNHTTGSSRQIDLISDYTATGVCISTTTKKVIRILKSKKDRQHNGKFRILFVWRKRARYLLQISIYKSVLSNAHVSFNHQTHC